MDTRMPWWQRSARSPWIRLPAGLGCILLPVLFMQLLVRLARLPPAVAQPIALLACMFAALFGYRAFVLWIEQRRVTELASARLGREALQGCALGAGLMVLTVGLLALLGSFHLDGFGSPRDALLPLVASIAAGVIEELALRGVVFRLVEEALGTWWSLAISALLFGALHLGNPHATPASAAAIALEAGVLLAAAYLLQRRLWLPMGIHAAWNFFQGGVFGIPVSGGASPGLLRSHLGGPACLSGGGFGAEATVVALLVCLAAGLVMLRRAWSRGQFIAARARRAPGAIAATAFAAVVGLAVLAAPGAARAANTVADTGFVVHIESTIQASPARVYQAFTAEVGRWWDPEHTYTNDAANLSIDAHLGGCFCERLPAGGGVEHLRIIYLAPPSLLRFGGALGPLQGSGLAGALTLQFKPAGEGTQLLLQYSVGGYFEGGFGKLAPAVEGMLGGQLERLKRYIETGKPGG